MNKILIIDDDIELCELLSEFFATEKISAESIHNGKSGLEAAKSGVFDLIVLDIMLPEMNGLDVLKNLRQVSQTPVIMLTARGEEVDRVLGLELGADDYLAKPFSPRELVARIRAIIRRLQNSLHSDELHEQPRYQIADIQLEVSTRTVMRNGELLSLTEVEFSILEQLMRTAGTVIERQELAQKVLGRRLSYDDRSLDVHMSNLRRKLGHYAGELERIKTIRGVGYLYVRP